MSAKRIHIPTARKHGEMIQDERGRFVEFKDPDVVYIGRKFTRSGYELPQSQWHNPHSIGKDGTREEVLQKYRDYLLSHPVVLARAFTELRGKTLACWCRPDEECHGDVLAHYRAHGFRRSLRPGVKVKHRDLGEGVVLLQGQRAVWINFADGQRVFSAGGSALHDGGWVPLGLWKTATKNAKEEAKFPKARKRHVHPPEQLPLPLDLGRVPLVRKWGRAEYMTTPARLSAGPTQPTLPPRLVWQVLYEALKSPKISLRPSKRPEKQEPGRGDSPDARAKRAARAAKLAYDIDYHDHAYDLYYRRRAEWARKVNERLQEADLVGRIKLEAPEPPEFPPKSWTLPDWAKGLVLSLETRDWWKYAPKPRIHETFCPMAWDEMVGGWKHPDEADSSKPRPAPTAFRKFWVPHEVPELGPHATLKDLFYAVPLDPDWETRERREVDLTRSLSRCLPKGFKIGEKKLLQGKYGRRWHVPRAVLNHPEAAKAALQEARAVLRSRTKAAQRGLVRVGTERLGRPKRLASEYEFWVHINGAWIPSSLLVAMREGTELVPVFRSVVQRENRKIKQRNKKRSPNGQIPLLAAFEATPSDFDPIRYRIRFTGKPSEPGERVEGYPDVRPDHTEECRETFLNLFKGWKEKRWDEEEKRWYNPALELGLPIVPPNLFDTDPKLAMFWTKKRLDASKSPKLGINWLWRRAGIREAIADPARQSKWITKERKHYLNREHYLNGLMVLTRHLALPPPITWRAPVDVMSYSGQTIKRAGERINLGSEAAEDAARVIARQRARKRQIEATYTLAGYYVSSTTGRRHKELKEALESVKQYYEDYKYKDRKDPFRAALNMELPGAVYVAAFDGRAEDGEYRREGEDGDVILGRYARSAKAYNERLRKLGYREYKVGEGWTGFPEDKPLPDPLETEIRALARDATGHVLHANRRCRRNFGNVWEVRDGDERRKLAPDTRSEETADWQLYDRKRKPDPAEYDIEAAVAEGDVEVAGTAYADPELNPEVKEREGRRPWKYEFSGMRGLASIRDSDSEADAAEAEDDYRPDFGTHHSLNLRVDAQGKKHLLRLEFPQREAVEGFRKYGLRIGDAEKYEAISKTGTLADQAHRRLYPTYRDALLLDWLGKKRLPEIEEQDGGATYVRYEDEETGEQHTVKTTKLADLRHELDAEGPSRFGLTGREREIFGCYYGTSEMTAEDIRKRFDISKSTYQREMKAVREKLAQSGIRLPAQAERRGRRAA